MGDLEIIDKPLKEKLLRNKEVKTAPITSRQTTFRPWKAKNISKQAAAGGSLRVSHSVMSRPWTARRSNQSILKEISPEYSLEGLMLKLKLHYSGPPDVKN